MTPARVTRLLTLEDAPALARLLSENRDFLAPWEPIREPGFFTSEGQSDVLRGLLDRHELGLTIPHVILTERGDVAGRITLDGIARGAFHSCGMGYWVAGPDNGRGLATAAVAALVRIAFAELGLHRVEAGTLVHNTRSQRVLERNQFVRYGLAPSLVSIAGRWQDHVMFQRINDDWRSPTG